jgi:S-adenosylmethionine synthetase
VDRESLLTPDLKEHVIDPVLVEFGLEHEDKRVLVNPTGRFEIGGPKADTGLTGRKIMVDSYGGMAPHGGGCFSGKDPTKVDRSAAYMARYAAKNVVASGLAERCQIQVAYAIGTAHPVSFLAETFGTSEVDPERIEGALQEQFDFRPAAIIDALDLRRPIYRETACYGHFGRKGFPWEETDRADELRRALS